MSMSIPDTSPGVCVTTAYRRPPDAAAIAADSPIPTTGISSRAANAARPGSPNADTMIPPIASGISAAATYSAAASSSVMEVNNPGPAGAVHPCTCGRMVPAIATISRVVARLLLGFIKRTGGLGCRVNSIQPRLPLRPMHWLAKKLRLQQCARAVRHRPRGR